MENNPQFAKSRHPLINQAPELLQYHHCAKRTGKSVENAFFSVFIFWNFFEMNLYHQKNHLSSHLLNEKGEVGKEEMSRRFRNDTIVRSR